MEFLPRAALGVIAEMAAQASTMYAVAARTADVTRVAGEGRCRPVSRGMGVGHVRGASITAAAARGSRQRKHPIAGDKRASWATSSGPLGLALKKTGWVVRPARHREAPSRRVGRSMGAAPVAAGGGDGGGQAARGRGRGRGRGGVGAADEPVEGTTAVTTTSANTTKSGGSGSGNPNTSSRVVEFVAAWDALSPRLAAAAASGASSTTAAAAASAGTGGGATTEASVLNSEPRTHAL